MLLLMVEVIVSAALIFAIPSAQGFPHGVVLFLRGQKQEAGKMPLFRYPEVQAGGGLGGREWARFFLSPRCCIAESVPRGWSLGAYTAV